MVIDVHYSHPQVVFQEVPDEISLALSISGCPLACQGCHSAFSWSPTYGDPLTEEALGTLLSRYQGMATCLLFYGGEWDPELPARLQQARAANYRVCLYSGHKLSELSMPLIHLLDYLKTGRWERDRGGLNSPNTNQRFYRINNGVLHDITHRFVR